MKITILVVGKTDKGYVCQGVDEYLKRLKRYIKTELVVLADVKNSKNLSVEQLIIKEEGLITAYLGNSSDIILLDENGSEYTSMEFSQFIQSKMLSGIKELVFVVGGAYGVSAQVKKKAQTHMALSRLTFSHQMVRLVLVEQIYRAMTILRGEPYHHQ
ncbi:MAG: 23S rRNA (pseudouridine(1915)-N(3))-methyltransferase RlmH [Bacteroidetes bacterium HGW-Bacteroidetes-15]|nr:MAG: 23S rRNA (pseudouridine(1915)-N(3))-methyltransferase RlmH [Bacteroidetes bacterium HGW-Bacteroidetes-15]